MKQILYRGGLVTFSIPSTWKEEYEDEGGGHFYEDREGSCTLHLNVLTFKSPKPTTPEEYLNVRRMMRPEASPEPLKNGQILSRYDKSDGDGLRTVWELARLTPSGVAHVAVFVLECSDRPEKDVALVDGIVRGAVVSSNA